MSNSYKPINELQIILFEAYKMPRSEWNESFTIGAFTQLVNDIGVLYLKIIEQKP